MANNTGSPVPNEFFTAQTFGTLGGCVVISGVVATAIAGVFRLEPKIVGLIVSILVAYAALFMARRKRVADYFVTACNGFLIYFTLVGATSFYPYLNGQTAAGVGKDSTDGSASVFRPWVQDRNLVSVSRDLVEINRQQNKALTDVHSSVAALENQVKALSIPAAAKADISRELANNKNLILMTHTNNAVRVTNLKRLGIQ